MADIRSIFLAAVILCSGCRFAAAETASTGVFNATSPLGINVADVVHLNAMPEQNLLQTGFLDVTKPPYKADPTGKVDSTKALADAIFFGRHHKLAVYFPCGDYLVSNKINCRGGWSDERTPNHKYLPWVETWPCVLVGDRRGPRKPRIILAPKSPGFGSAHAPKPVLEFYAHAVTRKNTIDPLPAQDGSSNYQQLLYGIDIEIGPGNPGAAAVAFDASEGSTIQDCTFDVGDGFTAIFGGPGSGGAIFNVAVNGGQIGMYLYSARPTCTLTGCRFAGQREAGLKYAQRGPLTLVGCEFLMSPGVPAIGIDARANGSASLVDCRIDYTRPAQNTVAIETKAAIFIRNSWIRNAGLLMSSPEGKVSAPESGIWSRVVEMASSSDCYTKPMTTPIYIDGKVESGIFKNLREGGDVPVDLRTRHLWDETTFPSWDRPGCVNVKEAPYKARGDGNTDDSAALQKAIDENETIFLPKGAYRVTKTLKLGPKTKIFGISPSYCMIVPMPVAGGDFTTPDDPKPVIRTADAADGETILAFFSVFMPREEGKACCWLDLAAGNTVVRCVLPIIGYTVADLDPLKRGIYPWTNWKWEDLESFALQTGFIKHFWTPYNFEGTEDTSVGPDSHEGGIPNWPMVRVHGNGSGRWYLFVDLDLQQHGMRHRRILVENTKGPFSIYHAQFQYGHGTAEMEVDHSENVTVYGIKNERPAIAMWIKNSKNILLTGVGGPSTLSPTRGKIAIENSSDVTLAGLTPDFHPDRPSMRFPFVRSTLKDGTKIETGPYERPALFKISGPSGEP